MYRRDFLRQLSGGVGGAALTARYATLLNPTGERLAAPERMAWWREARFGMFIHFGLYSTLGGEWKGKETGSHEWIRNNAKIPHDEYITLANRFNPVALDADAWVAAAKAAGQKYIVVTTKHHEGFSLFDSQVTTYDVMSTPFRRDVMREVAAACRRHDMRLGWYYSIMDWYHPDYLPRRAWETRDVTGADFPRYLVFMRAQLRELLTNYGDISVLWFDGQWESTWNHTFGQSLYDYVRALAPDIIVNNRVDVKVEGGSGTAQGLRQAGDFSTPELEVPAKGIPGEDWETCMTMNHNWGYSKFDHDFKTVSQLVALLVETASKGGNLLLNVGPMGDGRFPQESIDGLRGMGAWMKVNGQAIYGSTATPFDNSPYRVTSQAHRLNVFVDTWRGGAFELPGLRTVPRTGYLLGDRSLVLQTRQTPTGVSVTLPERGPDGLSPVVVLDFDEAPRIGES